MSPAPPPLLSLKRVTKDGAKGPILGSRRGEGGSTDKVAYESPDRLGDASPTRSPPITSQTSYITSKPGISERKLSLPKAVSTWRKSPEATVALKGDAPAGIPLWWDIVWGYGDKRFMRNLCILLQSSCQ